MHRSRNFAKTTAEIWNHYEIFDHAERRAACNYCKNIFSYKSTITNLKLHLKNKHVEEHDRYCLTETSGSNSSETTKSLSETDEDTEELYERFTGEGVAAGHQLLFRVVTEEERLARNILADSKVSNSTEVTQSVDNIVPDEVNSVKTLNTRRFRKIKAEIWNHFEILDHDERKAVCNYCKKLFSYKTTITNLKLHLKNKHEEEYDRYCLAVDSGSDTPRTTNAFSKTDEDTEVLDSEEVPAAGHQILFRVAPEEERCARNSTIKLVNESKVSNSSEVTQSFVKIVSEELNTVPPPKRRKLMIKILEAIDEFKDDID